MSSSKLITGPWTLKQLEDGSIGLKGNSLRVFSCFHCGGGSTMGYRLAGYDVIGGVEIDQAMMGLYRRNFNPRLSYLMGVQDFKKTPDELIGIDILDGSPPCSSFSMAGSREEFWGKSKVFREGQSDQVLDELFFRFIDIAKRIRPKVVIAENVKGLIIGNARGYVKRIFEAFRDAGYETQLFLLNASRMGVPQIRERTFFIARRKDLRLPAMTLEFDESPITVDEAWRGVLDKGEHLTPRAETLWRRTAPGQSFAKGNAGSWFNWIRLSRSKPSNTLPATCMLCHPDEPRRISKMEGTRIQSFPDDYDFMDIDPLYVLGMSVPPFMMQRVSSEVARQLFGKTLDPNRKPVVPYRNKRNAHPGKSAPVS